MYLQRDSKNSPIPFSVSITIDKGRQESVGSAYVRIGQLTEHNNLHGLGRKIDIYEPKFENENSDNKVITSVTSMNIYEG